MDRAVAALFDRTRAIEMPPIDDSGLGCDDIVARTRSHDARERERERESPIHGEMRAFRE